MAIFVFIGFLADENANHCGQCFFAFVTQLGFAIWNVPVGYKWVAVVTGYAQTAVSPLVYSWANEICREDADERAFVIASMLAISNAFAAWLVL